jgi:hypothetical protein
VTRTARRALPVQLGIGRNHNRNATRRRTNDRRAAHGNGTASSAVAPSERPYAPPIDPIYSGVVSPPGPNSWPLNTASACSVPRTLRRFCWSIRIAKQCGPFATYRRVSHSPVSVICRCIARTRREPQTKSGAPTQLPPRRRSFVVTGDEGVWIILSHAREPREFFGSTKYHPLAICNDALESDTCSSINNSFSLCFSPP